ncbi:MAG: metallophosphoesterase [Prevotella sp.]|nr:metallophosphoesterase [Prevotella sp.]
MIDRIIILLLLVLFLPQLYFDRRKWRRRGVLVRVLSWLPTLAMMVATVVLALERDFTTPDQAAENTYLLVLGLYFIPKAVYVLCSIVGRIVKKLNHSRYNWGNLVGMVLGLIIVYVMLYGSFIGVRRLNVNHVEITLEKLPRAYDGYKLVLFSDAHVGSFTGWRKKLLQRDIDSINAQKADAIVFAGDLQNLRPTELYPVQDMLRQLKAPDGVFSVLGNHDYSDYIKDDPAICAANEREMQSRQRQFGWTLLMNEWKSINRGSRKEGRLVFAGMENYSMKDSTQRADLKLTLAGIDPADCVILLQHDPSAWQQLILPEANVPLTLSGHTHGGQLSFFGLRATRVKGGEEDYGLYHEGHHQLYVTCGIGGLIPFRFGVSPEIAVITLKSDKH